MCKGFYKGIDDKDDIYASTLLLSSLKLVLLIGIFKNFSFSVYDFRTMFLHASLQEDVYIKPSVGFPPDGGVAWKPRKAMYGPKTAPKAWQLHLWTLWPLWVLSDCAVSQMYFPTSVSCPKSTTYGLSGRRTPLTGSMGTFRSCSSSNTWEVYSPEGKRYHLLAESDREATSEFTCRLLKPHHRDGGPVRTTKRQGHRAHQPLISDEERRWHAPLGLRKQSDLSSHRCQTSLAGLATPADVHRTPQSVAEMSACYC